MNFLNQLLIAANQCGRDDFATAHVSAQTHTHIWGQGHNPSLHTSPSQQLHPTPVRRRENAKREGESCNDILSSQPLANRQNSTHTHAHKTDLQSVRRDGDGNAADSAASKQQQQQHTLVSDSLNPIGDNPAVPAWGS